MYLEEIQKNIINLRKKKKFYYLTRTKLQVPNSYFFCGNGYKTGMFLCFGL